MPYTSDWQRLRAFWACNYWYYWLGRFPAITWYFELACPVPERIGATFFFLRCINGYHRWWSLFWLIDADAEGCSRDLQTAECSVCGVCSRLRGCRRYDVTRLRAFDSACDRSRPTIAISECGFVNNCGALAKTTKIQLTLRDALIY